MPTYRTPGANAPAKSEFELLSAGFPDPSPDLEEIPVDPDLIPRAGVLKDYRLNRVTNYEQARIDAYNADLSREMSVLAPNVPVSPPVSEKLVSVESPYNGDKGGMRTVDLAKGWPKPPPRAYGATFSTTTNTMSSRNDAAENTFDYGFQKYGVGNRCQDQGSQELSPTPRVAASQAGPSTFGPSTTPTPAQVSPFIDMREALSPDDVFHTASDNGVTSNSVVISVLKDGFASFRMHDAPGSIVDPDPDLVAAHKLSASQMIGCCEENVEEQLIDQAGNLTDYKLCMLQDTKFDVDAVRYHLSLELMAWAESLDLDCPTLKELFMMPKNDFYRFFSKIFALQDNAQDLFDFQKVEAQRFGVVKDGESSTGCQSRPRVPVASECSYSINDQENANGEESSIDDDVDNDVDDDEDDGGVVFGGRTRLSTPSIG